MRPIVLAPILLLAAACSGPEPAPTRKPVPFLNARRFTARVTDRGGGGTYRVQDAVIWVPETSLLGTAKGEDRDFLRVLPEGARETDKPVSVNLEEVSLLTVEELDEIPSRLSVTVQFRGAARTGKLFVGTVRSNLELRGAFEDTGLPCRVPLRRVAELEIAAIDTGS